MTQLSFQECAEWCFKRGIIVSRRGELNYEKTPIDSLTLSLPRVGLEIIALGSVLLSHLEDDNYKGSFFWLKDWDIWSPESEAVGMHLFTCQLPKEASFSSKGGQLFETNELVEQKSLLVIPMLFQWDAYLVPSHGNYIIFVDHDGYIKLVARTASELERIFVSLASWKPIRQNVKASGGESAVTGK